MKLYNVGKINELPIVLVYKSKNINELEKCIKDNLSTYRVKKNNELFKIDDDFLKETIIYCNKQSIKVKENKKLLNFNSLNNWLIIIDKTENDITEIFKKTSKKPSKKISKKLSKKTSKKLSKN
jgi:hypothetical protein